MHAIHALRGCVDENLVEETKDTPTTFVGLSVASITKNKNSFREAGAWKNFPKANV
jgi:hypothetical protein